MNVATIPQSIVWPEGELRVIGPPDGDFTGPVRAIMAVVDSVELEEGKICNRFNVRIKLSAEDIERFTSEEPYFWVSFLGPSMPPMAVGLEPEGVTNARRG